MWVVLIILLALITFHFWNSLEKKPLPRQPKEHFNTFANRAAVHEAGHAVTVWCCTLVREVGDVTIEHKQGGLTSFWTFKQETPESHWCGIVILLAGMAAEIAVFGKTRSGGCGPDLTLAREKAKHLVKSRRVTPPWRVPQRRRSMQFDKMFVAIDPAQERILNECYSMAHAILESYGGNFYRVVSVLLTKKTAAASDLAAVLGSRIHIKLIGVPVSVGWIKPAFMLPIIRA